MAAKCGQFPYRKVEFFGRNIKKTSGSRCATIVHGKIFHAAVRIEAYGLGILAANVYD